MPYDESVLVPLHLRYPAQFPGQGRAISLPLGPPDIMPTLLALTGLPIPETVEGRDLTKLLDADSNTINPAGDFDGVLIANYHPFADWRTERGGRAYRGIRTTRYTYVRDLNGPWLLFDNQEDPFQLKNQVNKIKFRPVQEQLDTQLKQILENQHDRFEPPEVLRERWNYQVDDLEEIPYEN